MPDKWRYIVQDAGHVLQLKIWFKSAQGVHLWHTVTARPKLIARFQQKYIFPARCPLESHCSMYESAWMTLADSAVDQRQALGTS